MRVPSGVTLSSLSLGDSHNCALSAAGPAYCWGLNNNAQLGNGRTSNSNVPVVVAATR